MGHLPYFVAAWLLVIGLFGIARSRHMVHLANCIAVLQAGSYVLLISVGFRDGGQPPIFLNQTEAPLVDPVVQALALTDIVVGATVAALLLAMAVQLQNKKGTADVDRLEPIADE
jgi:multicomponent Na+:H+ antiporter subunit C